MGKIKFYGLEEFIMELIFRGGLSSRQVSERALLEKGIRLSHTTIEVFKKNMLKHAREYFKNDEEYAKKLGEMQINSMELMLDTLSEIQAKIDGSRDNPKMWPIHSAYLDKSIKMLYIILKKNKEIGPDIQVTKTTNVMNVINAIQDRITELIDYLLNKGVSLEQFPPEYQEMYKKAKGMHAYA